MRNDIVITGKGVVSALGTDLPAVLDAIEQGRRGVRTAEVGGRTVPWAPVADYDPGAYVPRKKVRRMDPANTYAIAAARMALVDAGLSPAGSLERVQAGANLGVIVGTGCAGFASVVEHQRAYLRDGLAQLTPIHFPNTVYNASAGMVAIELGLDGPNSTVTGLDVSGEYALVYGWMLLAQEMAERVVVIGVDDLCAAMLSGLHDLGFAARDAQRPSQPLGRQRAGMVPGEGAGALVLERADAAAARGAAIQGRIEGIGIYASADTVYGYSRSSAPVQRASGEALAAAGLRWSDVDWVSSAANGSAGLDAAEADAWRALLTPARHAIVPLKRFTGEFGASGVLRLALALGCCARGRLPAALGDDPEPALAPFAAREAGGATAAGRRFLHLGLGLGGNCVALLIDAPEARRAH